MKLQGFSEIRTHDPRLNDLTTIFQAIFLCKNRAVVEDCSCTQGVLSSNLTKTVLFHFEIWFLKNSGLYFVGFQTKWIMTL